jgi:glycine hydroxymethyltransferase
MTALKRRDWVAQPIEDYVLSIAARTSGRDPQRTDVEIVALIAENRRIHEQDCINLNPATNVMNPKAEAALASGLGSRPSLGYPGGKHEMGLEAIEKIEVIAAELAAEVFGANFAEIRMASGAMANLYAFMATTKPGDVVIVPPASIGGHATHHSHGCAGLYGLHIHSAPVDAEAYSVDVAKLREMARSLRPKLITIGGSLNLFPHPIRAIREIAEEIGAKLLFDAAHLCVPIAGGVWQQPLAEGAHLTTMSTYKSLGGPPSGLIDRARQTPRCHRLPRHDRQFRRRKIRVPCADPTRPEGARCSLRGEDDRDRQDACAPSRRARITGACARSRLHHFPPICHRGRALRRRPDSRKETAACQ